MSGDENNRICNWVSLTRSEKANFLNSFFSFVSLDSFLFPHKARHVCHRITIVVRLQLVTKLQLTDLSNQANEWAISRREKKNRGAKSHPCGSPVLHRGRVTSYLVLFWYLSLRNSSAYSDPSVWGGSFTDEVRLLTAMKQYLKQIKRHFPQLDSCRFFSLSLSQVLRHTTKGWQKRIKKKNKTEIRICFGRYRNKTALSLFGFRVLFFFFSGGCQILQRSLTDGLDFYQAFFLPLTFFSPQRSG